MCQWEEQQALHNFYRCEQFYVNASKCLPDLFLYMWVCQLVCHSNCGKQGGAGSCGNGAMLVPTSFFLGFGTTVIKFKLREERGGKAFIFHCRHSSFYPSRAPPWASKLVHKSDMTWNPSTYAAHRGFQRSKSSWCFYEFLWVRYSHMSTFTFAFGEAAPKFPAMAPSCRASILKM